MIDPNYALLDNVTLNNLIASTENSAKGWSRICLHSSPSSRLHSMVMCMLPGVSSGMHRHKFNKDIITYSFLGNDFIVKVSPCDSSSIVETNLINRNCPVLALSDNTFRSVENSSALPVIYFEHRLGPYNKEDIIWL